VADRLRSLARTAATASAVAVGCAATGWLLGRWALAVAADRTPAWLVGRTAGLSAYGLLVALVLTGLLLAHPGRARWPQRLRVAATTRIRLHASLATGTLALTVLHVVVLAADAHAGVGWRGALLPMGASYRPVPVTLGVLGAYAGLLAGLTAALSGRQWAGRIWWPVHKVAVGSLLVVWAHGVLTGIDTPRLLWLYLGTGIVVLAVAGWRYAARTPADLVAELTRSAANAPGGARSDADVPSWAGR
jgi:hypothetical protein